MLKDVIVKNIAKTTSSILNIPFEEKFNANQLINLLINDYIKFNPEKEILFINGKTIDDSSINENDLRTSIYIFPQINITASSLLANVPSQYDQPFNIVTNQCSWISKEFLKNKDTFYKLISDNDKEKMHQLYIECMEKGTHERQFYGNLIQGENIDEIGLSNEIKSSVYGNSLILNMLDPEIVKMIVKPNIQKFNYNYFLSEIKNLDNNRSIIINRDGETFVFFKINNKYHIFDSHKRNIFEYDFNKLIDYILKNTKNGFFYILWSAY